MALVAACSAPATPEADPNPVRSQLTIAINTLPSDTPLQLRYNPAACDCPQYELRLAKRWVRAEWTNADAPAFAIRVAALQKSAPDAWPVAMLVSGKVSGEVRRTTTGLYTVSVEVAEIIGREKPARAPQTPQPGNTSESEPTTTTVETTAKPTASSPPK